MNKSLAAVVNGLAGAPGAAPADDRAAERDIAPAPNEIEVFEADAERLYAHKFVAQVDRDTPIGPVVFVVSDRPPELHVPGYAIAWIPRVRRRT